MADVQCAWSGGLGGVGAQELALEEAELLLDMATVSGDWDAIRGQLVSMYIKAGLNKLAFFVQAVGAPST
jgi:hypothetical protein